MARRAVLFGLALLASASRGVATPADEGDPRALLAADRPAEAAVLLRSRVRGNPSERSAWRALGEVERVRCDLEAARDAYDRALALDPLDATARAGLAETWLYEGRPEETLAHASQGLAVGAGRTCAALWRVRALAFLDLGRVDLALEDANRACALDPSDARAQEILARIRYRAGDMPGARAAYGRAAALDPRSEEANLRLGNGFGERSSGAPWHEGPEAEAFRAAVAAFDEGRVDEAGRVFERLCLRRPAAFKYRLGLGLSRVAIRRRNEVLFGGDAAGVYRLLPAPAFERLDAVVKGCAGLSDLDRHAVLVATLPARPFWDRLIAAGATHEVFGIDEDLTDATSRAELRAESTFDGRYYEHLRGVGGLAAATGVEKLREATAFGFHTFAHEFAHQVFAAGFSSDLRAEVGTLYASARSGGCCLDWYAASNVEEYFAQGYEAFVSRAKRGCLKETERHTRDDLAAKDPAFHAFLAARLDLSHEAPEAMAAFFAACPRR